MLSERKLFWEGIDMKTCITNKKVYSTLEMAEDALIDARVKFDFSHGSGPVTVYRCDDCGGYHLTSKGAMNEKLARYIAEGKLQRLQEANRWMRKIKWRGQ